MFSTWKSADLETSTDSHQLLATMMSVWFQNHEHPLNGAKE